MFHGTTIVAIRKNENDLAIAGDGQITFGEKMIMKHNANKIRKLYKGNVLVGFAGSVSDALTLTSKFEGKLEQYSGNLKRAAVELAKDWRQDKVLKKLEALMLAMDKKTLLIISGNGEVIEPDEGFTAIGSGGSYAYAAASALLRNTDLSAKEIAIESLKIASAICVFTNDKITVETLS
ncbi:MAG: ATP-dependent HslUV protease, peptidase subunit HslV [Candidatus Petromonas sp.]|jgi:ATP-dependent HslUV protease subunit HslV|nr:ATP-dependent HslUV protease, peptidase subunit HslV [Candidatus Petromonas sp.]